MVGQNQQYQLVIRQATDYVSNLQEVSKPLIIIPSPKHTTLYQFYVSTTSFSSFIPFIPFIRPKFTFLLTFFSQIIYPPYTPMYTPYTPHLTPIYPTSTPHLPPRPPLPQVNKQLEVRLQQAQQQLSEVMTTSSHAQWGNNGGNNYYDRDNPPPDVF